MTTAIQVWNYSSQQIRTITDPETGEPMWVAADVCRALEMKGSHPWEQLDEDEKGVSIVDTLGGPQEMVTVETNKVSEAAREAQKGGKANDR